MEEKKIFELTPFKKKLILNWNDLVAERERF